ncbi:hypothetical protein ES703_118296 [subsurface metagenome]
MVTFLSLTLLVGQQVLDLPAIALAQARRAGLPARALTPICFFNHALNSPNNLFFPYILRSRMAGGFSVNVEPVNGY